MKTAFPLQKPQSLEMLLEKALWFETSRALNRRSENVIVEAIIVPELKLRNVEWQVLSANFVERADDTALGDAPEALNRLSVNCAASHG